MDRTPKGRQQALIRRVHHGAALHLIQGRPLEGSRHEHPGPHGQGRPANGVRPAHLEVREPPRRREPEGPLKPAAGVQRAARSLLAPRPVRCHPAKLLIKDEQLVQERAGLHAHRSARDGRGGGEHLVPATGPPEPRGPGARLLTRACSSEPGDPIGGRALPHRAVAQLRG